MNTWSLPASQKGGYGMHPFIGSGDGRYPTTSTYLYSLGSPAEELTGSNYRGAGEGDIIAAWLGVDLVGIPTFRRGSERIT